MDSVSLPERSRHTQEERRFRRRRSAGRLPAVVAPFDVPEDAEGRVEFVVVRAPLDRDELAAAPPGPGPTRSDPVRWILTLGSGWVAVGGLAVLLVVIFVVLDLFLR
ncbi:MAG TPA: hypothetical protein VEK76_04935 [Candidatus Binatia bacterium]|nr:hypothetical protein [Candidatus Binatia bacterium]